jgi:hypothetical protein
MRTRRRLGVAVLGLAALALFLGGAGHARADLIMNGSFELPNVGSSFGLFPNGGVPGWTGINNEMEIDFTPILSPGVGTPAFNGAQSTEVDQTIQSISQTVTGLTPGAQYTLSWAFGLRPGAGVQGLDVTFGGGLVTHDTGTGGAIGTALIWLPNSFTVTATSASEVLTFAATGGNTQAGNELDAVSLVPLGSSAAVPEPSTLALLALGGIGLAGWRRWKGRRPQRNPAA